MGKEYDSLLEIAIEIMGRKKKPQSLESLKKEVFKRRPDIEPTSQNIAQFEVDFMVSGNFVYIGEGTSGKQLWDLKERQVSAILDKDGGNIVDIEESDEDVIKNELRDDIAFGDKNVDEYFNDDDSTEEEHDEIQDELGYIEDGVETEEVEANQLYDDEEDDEEAEEEEELDDIELEIGK